MAESESLPCFFAASSLCYLCRQRKFCFTIALEAEEKEYAIDAQTEAELTAWMRVIQDVRPRAFRVCALC